MSDLEKQRDVWRALQLVTQARIAVGRTGDSLPTETVMAFEVAQAQARDAVHKAFDVAAVASAVESLGLTTMQLHSAANDRATYLRRPDLGRKLSAESRERLVPKARSSLAVIVADGLSAGAAEKHAAPLVAELMQRVAIDGPIFIATQARVALGDGIGELVGAEAVLMLIGERPGLTTPESLGAYLTWAPRIGRTDAERNCVSNIHGNGLSYAAAALKLSLLLQNARKLGATGVDLKDESEVTMHLPTSSED
jgi:ethanolamine ammonia-lyase small subunit